MRKSAILLASVAFTCASAVGTATTVAASTAAPTTAAVLIQPGTEILTDVGGCTANFVYDGIGTEAGKVFLGTAAHCVDGVGDEVRLGDDTIFGHVAFVGDENITEDDYAFIEVHRAFVSRVSPAVKGHPSYPTGVAGPGDTGKFDLIQFSGYGIVFSATTPTREKRVGLLTYDDADIYEVTGPVIFGDSGGPLVHMRTGRALGVVSRLCLGSPCSVEGPTIAGSLAKAEALGFTVALRTIPGR